MKTDSQLQREVRDELAWEPALAHVVIFVEVNSGVVTLAGTVCTNAQKWTAARVAQRVADVKALAVDIQSPSLGALPVASVETAVPSLASRSQPTPFQDLRRPFAQNSKRY